MPAGEAWTRVLCMLTESLDALLAMAPVLVGLALVDSLSVGTLLVPVWLLLSPGRLRPRRVLLYLGTIATFYLVVGAALLTGIDVFFGRFEIDWQQPQLRVGLFLIGLFLLVLSFILEPPGGRSAEGRGRDQRRSRLMRWRDGLVGSGNGSTNGQRLAVAGVGVLALTAGMLEVATMVPYLAGVGIVAAEGVPFTTALMVLAGYCLVMILPALLLLAARMSVPHVVEGFLRRIDVWSQNHAASTAAWIIGIVGVILMIHNFAHVVAVLPWTDVVAAERH